MDSTKDRAVKNLPQETNLLPVTKVLDIELAVKTNGTEFNENQLPNLDTSRCLLGFKESVATEGEILGQHIVKS